jgi:hypothetical protein
MGFRFRKSVKLFPGVRLNISKGGLSTSIGGRGATFNLSKRGVRGTAGIPGSGLSYSTMLSGGRNRSAGAPQALSAPMDPAEVQKGFRSCLGIVGVIFLLFMVLVFIGSSGDTPATTSPTTTETASIDTTVDMRTVKASSAYCRLKPSTSAAIVTTIARGGQAREIDQKDGWIKVFNGDDACWISSSLLEE